MLYVAITEVKNQILVNVADCCQIIKIHFNITASTADLRLVTVWANH
jgi:hypothetical protein